jgi:hypothetical protein
MFYSKEEYANEVADLCRYWSREELVEFVIHGIYAETHHKMDHTYAPTNYHNVELLVQGYTREQLLSYAYCRTYDKYLKEAEEPEYLDEMPIFI